METTQHPNALAPPEPKRARTVNPNPTPANGEYGMYVNSNNPAMHHPQINNPRPFQPSQGQLPYHNNYVDPQQQNMYQPIHHSGYPHTGMQQRAPTPHNQTMSGYYGQMLQNKPGGMYAQHHGQQNYRYPSTQGPPVVDITKTPIGGGSYPVTHSPYQGTPGHMQQQQHVPPGSHPPIASSQPQQQLLANATGGVGGGGGPLNASYSQSPSTSVAGMQLSTAAAQQQQHQPQHTQNNIQHQQLPASLSQNSSASQPTTVSVTTNDIASNDTSNLSATHTQPQQQSVAVVSTSGSSSSASSFPGSVPPVANSSDPTKMAQTTPLPVQSPAQNGESLPQPSKPLGEDTPSSGLSTASSSGQGNSVEGHDQQKTRLIQQQLVLLLHANKCLQRERENPAHTCNLQYCRTMKDVLRHMMRCTESQNCTYGHCVSSRQIIMHWKQCGRSDCSICTPVKGVIKPGSVHEGGAPGGGDVWQNAVQMNLRDHLIKRMLQGIYPVQNYESARQNPQYMKLVAYFKRIEEDFFNTCRSKEEYFSKLADKYKQVQAEIQRTTPRAVGPGGVNQPMAAHQPAPFNPDASNPFPGAYTPSPSVMDSIPMSLPTDPVRPIPSVPQSSASPGPTSEQSTQDMKPQITTLDQLKSPTPLSVEQKPDVADLKPSIDTPERQPSLTSPPSAQPQPQPQPQQQLDPPSNTPLTKPSPPSLPQPPSLTSPPLKTPGESSQQVQVATASTPAEPPLSAKIVPNPQLKKEFSREEMEDGLRPLFRMLWEQPDAFPFHEPVNPQRLGIPDYFNIVKTPMDMSTIDSKLVNGEYKDPWEFCKDMWLMFENAWLYNKKTSKVYKMCTKLYEIFRDNIDNTMRSFGYCCGSRYSFSPQVLYCFSKNLCPIPRDAPYYSYENRYVYCVKCFSEIPGDTVSIGDDPFNSTVIEKTKFIETKNSHIESEPTVDCIHCGRNFHKICVLWHETIWSEGYQCDQCIRTLNTTRKENKYSAKKLPTSQLSVHLENRVNNFLRQVAAGAGEITIRVVSSTEKVLDTKCGMKEKFPDFSEKLPYKTKAMFVFEEIDGVDVCFFGMHVQEYSSECPAPNRSRVYISYLDSVHFFQPRDYRTLVYHEILIGYLDFVKTQGYETAHIWACPPSEGDDYIFHCHPPEQKIPKPKRLQEWYRSMLERARDNGVIHDFYDIYQYYEDEHMTDVQGLPYFEGDFWPNVIEEQIKELELEEERIATEANEAESQKLSSKRSSKKACKKAGKSKQPKKAGDLSQRLLSIMERHKEVFFVVRLNQEKAFAKTTDPDPLVTCDLMEGRDAFLTMAREKHWEFSSLRRAKFSTLSMLVQLHHSGSDRFIYHCNHCEKPIESRYTCSECEDFDLCEPCYNKVGHKHPMKKVGMGLVEIEQGGEPLDQREAVNRAIQRTVEALLHAAQCKDRNCKNNSCLKMKQVMYHVRRCRACPVCKQFMSLCMLHAKQCKDKDCTVPLCTNLKKRFQERQRESQIIQSRIMQRRMQLMRRDSSPSVTASSNTVAPSPAPSTPHPTQPSTPSTKAPAKNSPIPSPAISRNPGSVPPTASQPSPGPGGKTLNASQEPVHGPPSVPGKMMNSPSPHPRTMGGPTYASPVRSASSDLITMRKHPEHVLQHIPRHAASIPSTVPNNGGQYATQGYPTPQGSSTHMPHVYPNQAAYPGNPPANRMMSYQDRMQYAAHQRPNHMSRSTYGVQGMGHPTAMEMGTSPGMPHPQSRQAYTTQVHPHHQQQLVMQQQQQPQQRQMNMQTMQQQQRYPHPHQPTAGRYPQQYAQGPTPMHTQPPPQQTQHGDPTFNPGYQDSLQSNYSSQSGGDFLNQLSKLL